MLAATEYAAASQLRREFKSFFTRQAVMGQLVNDETEVVRTLPRDKLFMRLRHSALYALAVPSYAS